jgi:Tfp pilus assembly protein PilO
MAMKLNKLNLNSNNIVLRKAILITSWVGISFFVVLVFVVFLWQLRANSIFRRNLSAKKKEVKETQQANRRFEELKKQSDELKLKEELLEKRLPIGEKQPMGLIKKITLLARARGLEKINFQIKSKSSLEETKSAVALAKDLTPLYFEMEFETTFPALLEFLKELANLERVIAVEKMDIKREKEILPNQKITLSLITYTFQTSYKMSAPGLPTEERPAERKKIKIKSVDERF